MPAPGPGLVPQPVGWQGARAAAEARVQSLRSSGLVPAQQAIVAAEGFIVQLQPERSDREREGEGGDGTGTE